LLGFHVPAYRENFLDCVSRGLDGASVDRAAGTVTYDGHTTRVEAFPMGVDASRIGRLSDETPESFWPEFRREHGVTGSTVAVGVDRLDYTKGIPERIDALERFWERNPEWRGELTYVQKASESRSAIPAYQRLQNDVHDAIERVNDRFGTEGWTPIVYVDDHLSDADLYGLYRHSDLALVTPIRDGMNLVAKEYVAAQPDAPGESGALLLSDLAGADVDLG
ncbi:trehalose-6-phosphate synthase, partial [Halobium palmae]